MSSSYYISLGRQRMARRVMQLRGQGYDRVEIVGILESEGSPNECVLVDSIFDAPVPASARRKIAQGRGEQD